VSGNGDIINPALVDAGATKNFFQDTGPSPKIHGWNEAQGVRLDRDVYVDITTSGTFNENSDLAGFRAAKVNSGTLVDSHLLYYDPKNSSRLQNVTFTFSGQILGVIVESDRFYKQNRGWTDYFLESDFLGNPDAIYPTDHFVNRGLELGSPNDAITVSIAGNTITIDDFRASNPGDQIRVLTMSIPEPSTFVTFGVSAVVVALYRLRRRRDRD